MYHLINSFLFSFVFINYILFCRCETNAFFVNNRFSFLVVVVVIAVVVVVAYFVCVFFCGCFFLLHSILHIDDNRRTRAQYTFCCLMNFQIGFVDLIRVLLYCNAASFELMFRFLVHSHSHTQVSGAHKMRVYIHTINV